MKGRLIRQLVAEIEDERPLREGAAHQSEPLGLSDARLLELAGEHHFGAIASSFPAFGGPLGLRQLAWWGSALADIGCAAGSLPIDEILMADAARFYLGVALFDDVVDRTPARAAALSQLLHPARLRLKLDLPDDPEARLRCDTVDLSPVVGLFDKALEGIGRRLADEREWREQVAQTLEAMYWSELSLSDEPMAAKTLPFALVGQLALQPRAAEARAFFGELARLLALWDDWQDLVPDGWARAPNAHLGPPASSRLGGVGRGMWLAIVGNVPFHPLSRRLALSLTATLSSARPLPEAAREKVRALLLQMLGARAVPLSEPPPIGRAPAAS